MKKIFYVAVAIIVFAGCNITNSTDIDIAQIVPLSQGGKTDGVIEGGTCPDVDRVVISANPSQLAIGQSERIDVTPKDKNGKPRDPDCDERSGVNWSSNSDVCTIKDDESFVTEVKGVKAGSCNITAVVSGKSDSESFPVL